MNILLYMLFCFRRTLLRNKTGHSCLEKASPRSFVFSKPAPAAPFTHNTNLKTNRMDYQFRDRKELQTKAEEFESDQEGSWRVSKRFKQTWRKNLAAVCRWASVVSASARFSVNCWRSAVSLKGTIDYGQSANGTERIDDQWTRSRMGRGTAGWSPAFSTITPQVTHSTLAWILV